MKSKVASVMKIQVVGIACALRDTMYYLRSYFQPTKRSDKTTEIVNYKF